MISGVIKGSVLGPILFIIFINDLPYYVKHSILRCFADDTRLTKAIENSQRDTSFLQSDLESVINWSVCNNMLLNETKFELITFPIPHRCNVMHDLPFYNDYSNKNYTTNPGNELQPVSSLRDLGIIIADDFSWSEHISKITTKATQMSAWVMSIYKHRGKQHMLIMYKSFVRSHLEFSCPLWNPYKITDITNIEKVQRSFTAKIHGYQHYNYWERLVELKLQSLQRRRERYIIIYKDMFPTTSEWYLTSILDVVSLLKLSP